jgi:hypothetical protein
VAKWDKNAFTDHGDPNALKYEAAIGKSLYNEYDVAIFSIVVFDVLLVAIIVVDDVVVIVVVVVVVSTS